MFLFGVAGGAPARWTSQYLALISRVLDDHKLRICGFTAIIDLMASEDAHVSASMLLAFRSENVRSFRDALELSLLATALAKKGVPHEVPWRAGGRPIQVLPAVGVFGANASGKSNLLRAIADMRDLVLGSFRHADPSGGIRRTAFRLDPSRKGAPSRFEVDLVLHGIRHEYGFVIDDERVLEEWAYRYPRGKAALLFRRDGDAVTLGEHNRAKGRAVIEILRPNSLLLSAAAAANHPDLLPLHQWFGQNLLLAEAGSRPYRWAFTAELLRREDRRAQVLALLRAAEATVAPMPISTSTLRKSRSAPWSGLASPAPSSKRWRTATCCLSTRSKPACIPHSSRNSSGYSRTRSPIPAAPSSFSTRMRPPCLAIRVASVY